MSENKQTEGFEMSDEDDEAYLVRIDHAVNGQTYLEAWANKYRPMYPNDHLRAANLEDGHADYYIEKYGYAKVVVNGVPVTQKQGGTTQILLHISNHKKALIDRKKKELADAQYNLVAPMKNGNKQVDLTRIN